MGSTGQQIEIVIRDDKKEMKWVVANAYRGRMEG